MAWSAPQKSRHKLDTRKGLVKYDSGYALILQPLLTSASQPCKSVCRLGPSLPFFGDAPRTLHLVGVLIELPWLLIELP